MNEADVVHQARQECIKLSALSTLAACIQRSVQHRLHSEGMIMQILGINSSAGVPCIFESSGNTRSDSTIAEHVRPPEAVVTMRAERGKDNSNSMTRMLEKADNDAGYLMIS